MQRLPTGKYIGVMVICWGIVVACTSACDDYGPLVAIRLTLGIFESAVAPCLILISTIWYKRSERPARVGLWFFGVGSSVIIGSLTSFGSRHYHDEAFRSWKVLFLIVVCVTVMHGVVLVRFPPDNPMSLRRKHAEKVLAVELLRENRTDTENKQFKLY